MVNSALWTDGYPSDRPGRQGFTTPRARSIAPVGESLLSSECHSDADNNVESGELRAHGGFFGAGPYYFGGRPPVLTGWRSQLVTRASEVEEDRRRSDRVILTAVQGLQPGATRTAALVHLCRGHATKSAGRPTNQNQDVVNF